MAGLLSAGMKTQAATPAHGIVVGWEIDLPSGTVRWATTGIHSASRGFFEGRIAQAGQLHRAISYIRPCLELPQVEIVAEDQDQFFAKKVAAGEPMEDVAARMYFLHETVAPSLYGTFRLIGWKRATSTRWLLTLDMAPLALLSSIAGPTMTPGLFPHADAANMNRAAPVVLGFQDSAGQENKGAIPCLLVKNDANPFRYLYSFGYAFPNRVYQDDSRLATSQYSITHPTIGGFVWTFVEFTTTRGTSRIAADGVGLETVGDGTGTILTRPYEILQHLMANFAYTHNSGVAWVLAGAMDALGIDTNSFAEADLKVANSRKYRAAVYISEPTSMLQLINSWCDSFQIPAMLGVDGKIKLRPFLYNTFRVQGQAVSSISQVPAIEQGDDTGWPDAPTLAVDFSVDSRVNRAIISAGKMVATGTELATIEVQDKLAKDSAVEQLTAEWGPALL
jgi:hypothetical protein